MDEKQKQRNARILQSLSSSGASGYAMLSTYLALNGLRLSAPYQFAQPNPKPALSYGQSNLWLKEWRPA